MRQQRCGLYQDIFDYRSTVSLGKSQKGVLFIRRRKIIVLQ
jgi:hypothetical protein